MNSIEIRVLGPAGIEDHHAHLLRLDPAARNLSLAGASDDRGVDGHCLRLVAAEAILIGGFIDGTLRASLEIIPNQETHQAEATFTSEAAFRSSALTRMVIARLFDEARGQRITSVELRGLDDIELLKSAANANNVEIDSASPQRFHLATQPAMAQSRLQPSAAAYA